MDLINIPYQEIKSKIPQEEKNKLLSNQAELATNQCIRFGITSFQDAGSSWEEIQFKICLQQWFNKKSIICYVV